MKIEVNILLAKIKLMQKNQKYILRITDLDYQNSISQRFSENFTENHQNILRLNVKKQKQMQVRSEIICCC